MGMHGSLASVLASLLSFPQSQVPSNMGPSCVLLLLAVALGATAAARCPAPCVCDNLRAHVLCLNGSLTAIPDTIPEVGKKKKG